MRKMMFVLAMGCFWANPVLGQFNFVADTAGLADVYESGPTEFEIGDIDNDGDPDIICVGDHMSPLYTNEYGIMVYRNTNNGSVWVKNMSGDFGYGGVALGDVNNDGFMDVAYGVHHNYSANDFGDQLLEVVLGNGTGYTWFSYDDGLALQNQNWGMFGCDFADIDNDGLLDLGANSFGSPDGVWLYRNNGDGTWGVFSGAKVGNSSHNFKFGDFNKDGYIDFIANNSQYNGMPGNIWKGDGTGFFTALQSGFPYTHPSNYGFKFSVADVNHDGAMDFALTYGGSARVYTLDLSSNTWINISSGLPAGNIGINNLALGDMDNDGHCDLVAFKDGGIYIFKGNGAGTWTAADTIAIAEATCADIKLGDFDRNGLPDIAYMAKNQGNNWMRVYRNMATGIQPETRMVFPGGNEILCGNSVQFASWSTNVPAGIPSSVNIALSTSGVSGPYITIALNKPNSGKFQWITPPVTSADCYLRLIIATGTVSDTVFSDTAFSIMPCVTVPVISGPIAGDSTFCHPGDTLTFSISPVYGAVNYTWTFPQGWTGSSATQTLTVIPDTSSGVVSVTANSTTGSSLPASINVLMMKIDTAVVAGTHILTSATQGATYQWVDCSSGIPVPGGVNQGFSPTISGSFKVVVTKNGCVDSSGCHYVTPSGIESREGNGWLLLTPNPASDKVTVSAGAPFTDLELINMVGSIIFKDNKLQQRATIDLSEVVPGLYLIRLKTTEGFVTRKIIKL